MNHKRLQAIPITLLIGLMLALPSFTWAQSPEEQNADTLFQAHQWGEAAKAYEALTKADPTNGRGWYRLGAALLAAGEYERSVRAFQKALEISKRAEPMYGLASAYAMLKDKERAFEWLDKALNAHLPQPEQIEKDPNLASLRDDPRFKDTRLIVERLNNPCLSQPEYKQFDFWVGEWAVTAEGQQVARSRIERIVNGCIIFENYTQADGYTGKSFNFYDATLRRWRQTWVDATGRVSEFAGVYKDNAMHFEGESHLQDGTKVLRRMTLFNLGAARVRQLSEASTDGGKTWRVTYDFIYSRSLNSP